MKYDEEENEVRTKAFLDSKAKTVELRDADAESAVLKHREFKKGAMKAVDDSLRTKAVARNKRMDEAIDGPKKP